MGYLFLVHLMSITSYATYKHHAVNLLIVLLLAGLPITMLTEIRGGSANFWALLTVCIAVCFNQNGGFSKTFESLKTYKVLFFSLLLLPITVILSMAWSYKWLGADTERAARAFLGTIFILGATLTINKSWLRQSIWGIMLGVLSGSISIVWMTWPHFKRPYMDQYTTVGYSNILLVLIVMIVFSFGWKLTPYRKTERLFKILSVFIGLIGLVIAETRSSWIAMPFFIVIGLYLIHTKLSTKRIFLIGILTVSLCTALFLVQPQLLERFKLVRTQIVDCYKNNILSENSVCTRIQLWNASWHMFKANPYLANAGSDKFEVELEKLHNQGIVTKSTKDEFGEPHNDLFHALANYGIVGFIAYLLFYVVPGWIFIRRMSQGEKTEIRVAAAMGTALCVGFIIFGITETMFRSMRMLSFYAVMIALLLALSDDDSKKL